LEAVRDECERIDASNVIDSLTSKRLRILDLAKPFYGEDGVSRVGRGGEAWYFRIMLHAIPPT